MVIEFAGEIISQSVANERERMYSLLLMYYVDIIKRLRMVATSSG